MEWPRYNPMHPLYVSLSGHYMTMQDTCTGSSGRTSEHLFDSSLRNLSVTSTFIPLSVSLWNELADTVGVGLAGFKSRAIALLMA